MSSSKPANIYAGGYSLEKKAKLEATKLPDKIRCKFCNKLRPSTAFSQRQLGDYRQRLARNPRLADPSQAIIPCVQCTPAQVTELECSQCGLIKALDGFTKAQRRDPDFARCILCVNKDLKAHTAGTQDIKEINSDSDGDDNDDDDDDGVTNPFASTHSDAGSTSYLSNATDRLNINDDSDGSENNPFAPKAQGSNHGSNDWAGFARQQELQSLQSTGLSGSNASGNTHRQLRAPSTAGSIETTTTLANRSNFARVKSDNKDKKGRPPGLIKVTDAAKAVGRQVYRGDSDSDSDDYGYI